MKELRGVVVSCLGGMRMYDFFLMGVGWLLCGILVIWGDCVVFIGI